MSNRDRNLWLNHY